METIINQTCEKLNGLFHTFFCENHSLEEAERFFGEAISEATVVLLGAYYEELDLRLKADKEYRKSEGMTVHKTNVHREELTSLGTVSFNRTYYHLKDGTYDYPIDSVAGIVPYQRISKGISQSLANVAIKHSYMDASKFVTGGMVSKQTVMNKIRSSKPCRRPAVVRGQVPVLHIDADEDHVSLQNRKSDVAVPSITVYECVEHTGKRGHCKNAFGISEYGKSSEELWEEVYDEIEKRYDIDHCQIYIHGDGAAWIKYAVNLFPNSIFVLDPYHKNEHIKKAVSGMEDADRANFSGMMVNAFRHDDVHELMCIQGEMAATYPERIETILEGTNYLLNNFAAISVYYNDPVARNGGATEPHVSHMLSSRLSSRPMGWSEKTLEKIAPILAAGSCYYEPEQKDIAKTTTRHQQNKYYCMCDGTTHSFVPNSLGLPHPDIALTDAIFGQADKKRYSYLTGFWI